MLGELQVVDALPLTRDYMVDAEREAAAGEKMNSHKRSA